MKRVVNEGYKIDFIQQPELPIKMSNPKTDPEGQKILDEEVRTMLEKQVIRKVDSDQEGAISPFFAQPKSTKGKWRPILSLSTCAPSVWLSVRPWWVMPLVMLPSALARVSTSLPSLAAWPERP